MPPVKPGKKKEREKPQTLTSKPETIPFPSRSDDLNETWNKKKRIQGERLIDDFQKFLKS